MIISLNCDAAQGAITGTRRARDRVTSRVHGVRVQTGVLDVSSSATSGAAPEAGPARPRGSCRRAWMRRRSSSHVLQPGADLIERQADPARGCSARVPSVRSASVTIPNGVGNGLGLGLRLGFRPRSPRSATVGGRQPLDLGLRAPRGSPARRSEAPAARARSASVGELGRELFQVDRLAHGPRAERAADAALRALPSRPQGPQAPDRHGPRPWT